jgi:1-acyl-sn-glycerol-3-phosphate acyltransferase
MADRKEPDALAASSHDAGRGGALARALDWGATGAVAGGFLAALASFEVIMRVAALGGDEAHQAAASGMARACNRAVRLAGARFRATGLENVAPGQNYVIVSNHQSMLDITMASEFLAALQPRYVSKRELARGFPGVSYNLRRGGSALIDRKDPAQAHAEIARLGAKIRDAGWSVVIFPEGTRSKTGAMRPFRSGGLRTLLREAGPVPILPVTTSGGSRLFARELRPIVRGVELTFQVHAPVSAPDPEDLEGFEAFVARLAATIGAALPAADRDASSPG